MKHFHFAFALLATIVWLSCQKEGRAKDVYGTYIGTLTTKNSGIEEVFTDPNTSHFESYIETTIRLDTIYTQEEANDTFFLDPFPCLLFFMSAKVAAKDTIHHTLSLLGGAYSEQVDLFFNTKDETLYFKGETYEPGTTTFSKSEFMFEGVKQ
jgi:hypothetical protein